MGRVILRRRATPVAKRRPYSYRVVVMYATTLGGLWWTQGVLHFTFLNVALRRWEGHIFNLMYLAILHTMAKYIGGAAPHVLVPFGFWVIGVSFWPIPNAGWRVRHAWILLGNVATLLLMRSGVAQGLFAAKYMYSLGARPNLLTLNVVSVTLMFLNAIPLCCFLAATTLSMVAPFITALLMVPAHVFPDQFTIAWSEKPARQSLRRKFLTNSSSESSPPS